MCFRSEICDFEGNFDVWIPIQNRIMAAIFSRVMEIQKVFIFSESRANKLFKKSNDIKIASRSSKIQSKSENVFFFRKKIHGNTNRQSSFKSTVKSMETLEISDPSYVAKVGELKLKYFIETEWCWVNWGIEGCCHFRGKPWSFRFLAGNQL